MPKFQVQLEKRLTATGTITVETANEYDALDIVDNMIATNKNPLQSNDNRIHWENPEYDDNSFKMTDEVYEVYEVKEFLYETKTGTTFSTDD